MWRLFWAVKTESGTTYINYLITGSRRGAGPRKWTNSQSSFTSSRLSTWANVQPLHNRCSAGSRLTWIKVPPSLRLHPQVNVNALSNYSNPVVFWETCVPFKYDRSATVGRLQHRFTLFPSSSSFIKRVTRSMIQTFIKRVTRSMVHSISDMRR
jgi:hypothetical protein